MVVIIWIFYVYPEEFHYQSINNFLSWRASPATATALPPL
jgi:hypothetical protein